MKRSLALCAFALILLAAWPASGSTFVAMSPKQMVAASQAVVVGRVLDVKSFWNDQATAIVTEAYVQVDQTVEGEAPGVVVVRTFGGQVGSIRIEAHGFPTFHEGQRMLLFLDSVGGEARVVGYQQGQYRIVRRQSDGADIAVPALDAGASLVSPDGKAVARARALPLGTLIENIHSAGDALRAERLDRGFTR